MVEQLMIYQKQAEVKAQKAKKASRKKKKLEKEAKDDKQRPANNYTIY